MAKSIINIIYDLDELIKKKGNNKAITMQWDQFYKICERERLHDSVLSSIRDKLKSKDIGIIYGNNAVIVARDSNWRPTLIEF